MQGDPQTELQSTMTAGDKTGQFYGSSKINAIFIIIENVFAECPSGHRTFIGNVSLIVSTMATG